MQITFIEDEQGNVSEMVVNQEETEMRAKWVDHEFLSCLQLPLTLGVE